MDDSFFAYLQKLELIGFFSAYPLLYAIINVLTGNSKKEIIQRLPFILPYSYALVGTLYLGLQLKNLYPDFSIENIRSIALQPFLIIWALLSLLFWIPGFAKRPFISLLHSLVFFFLLLKDMVLQLFAIHADRNILRNEMKVYTDSILLNIGSIFMLSIIYLLIRFKQKKKGF